MRSWARYQYKAIKILVAGNNRRKAYKHYESATNPAIGRKARPSESSDQVTNYYKCCTALWYTLRRQPNRRIFFSSYLSYVGCADDEALTRLLQTSFLVVYQFFYFSIVSSFTSSITLSNHITFCKSFLVSCQAVTSPLLVGYKEAGES